MVNHTNSFTFVTGSTWPQEPNPLLAWSPWGCNSEAISNLALEQTVPTGAAVQSPRCTAALSCTFSFHLYRTLSSCQAHPTGDRKWKRKLHCTAVKGSTVRRKHNTAWAVPEAAVKLLCSQSKHFRKWNATVRNLSRQGWKTKGSSKKHLASWKRYPKTFASPSVKMALNSKAGCNTEVFCYPDDCYLTMQATPAELIGAIQEH